MEAVAAIELAQERSRTQWLEQELERLTRATENDRKYFERQLAEFAGESSLRLKQQKQAARLERMRAGTYVTQYSSPKRVANATELLGATGVPETVRRFMRLSECGMYLLFGTSESDVKVIKVAIGGISSIEIGHKTSAWKSIALATPRASPGTETQAMGESRSSLPLQWQCLTFVLKDASREAKLLSTDNDVDAALWCVGLRLILEQLEGLAPGAPTPSLCLCVCARARASRRLSQSHCVQVW